MRLVHFYHLWLGGEWQTPLGEHLQALADAGYTDPVLLNSITSGFEQDTINKVREYALTHDGAVLYAHTKGACDTTPFRAEWRRAMTEHLIGNWRENLDMLNEVQAVGSHWLTRDVYGNMIETPFFSGNYWLARCDYLRTLPTCSDLNRFQAERWIGLNDPTVVDLFPGWPTEGMWK